MSGGLLALLDDVAVIAKIAAASLDDVVANAAKAGTKAAGIVIDDAAVTPRYVVGFAADRELPIIGRIALGSLKNKLIFLLPAALLLSAFAPWAITPLLMAGGAFLCFEGYEKVHGLFQGRRAGAPSDVIATPAVGARATTAATVDAKTLEDQKIAGAIRTDLILSAEIMAIALSSVSSPSLITQGIVLALVGIFVTVLVYGAVAIIVKVDDVGVALARNARPVSSLVGLRAADAGTAPTPSDTRTAPFTQRFGRALVSGMPGFLAGLSLVGTLAMLWVGGGIIVHGLHGYGVTVVESSIHAVALGIGGALPVIGGAVEWLVSATGAGLIGLAVGWVVARFVPQPH